MFRALRELAVSLQGLILYTDPTTSPLAGLWRRQDLAALAGAPYLDPTCLGRLLGAGLQHRIYEYTQAGEPMVLKILIPRRWLRFPTAAEAQQDVEFISRCLTPYAVEPVEVIPLGSVSFAVKQRRLAAFHAITPRDLDEPALRQQFLDLARRNLVLLAATGRSLDFLGREGQRKCRAALLGLPQTPTIANLVVELLPTPHPLKGIYALRILDTDLENLRPGARTLRDLRSALAARIALAINRWLIRHFFDVDISNP